MTWQNLCTMFLAHIEHKVLRLSSCDWSMSIVRRQQFALKAYFSTPLGQLTQNLVGSIGVTCRAKIAKIVLSEIEDGHHLKFIFHFWNKRPTDLKLGRNHQSDLKIKIAFRSEIQGNRHGGGILKIYFSLLMNQKANRLETWWEASRWLVDQK